MNYARIYNQLVERARNRKCDEFTESHHILPRCLGGGDEYSNLVDLTPEEHYVAHQLLVKIYPNNHALVKAAAMMVPNRPSNKLYGWLRRKHRLAMSVAQSGSGNSQFGTKWIHNGAGEVKKILKNNAIPEGWELGRGKNRVPDVLDECPVCKKLKKIARKFCSLSCSAKHHNLHRETVFDDHIDGMIQDYKSGMSIYQCLVTRNLCGTGANHVKLTKLLKNNRGVV